MRFEADPARSRCRLNEPLGATVVRMPVNTRAPFWVTVTRQRRPTRFWSTSNSVSTRPSSNFAFSFDTLPAEHLPPTTTPLPPLPPEASAVEAATASSATSEAIPMSVSLCIATLL
jgi:hypothetical protein